nr:TPA_asm: hypothetical protein HUJ06_005347 [Nelumbo nucifera]
MAHRLSLVLALILLLLPLLSHGKDDRSRPFEFLRHLEGCRKGETVKGLNELKRYLERFGYLNNHKDDDDFDDLLELAIKTYQLNYNLNVTGSLDPETLKQMSLPRCGAPDITNGTTSMRSGKEKKHPHERKTLHTVSRYSFFSGIPRWPPSKTLLTYAFLPGTPVSSMRPVCDRAFQRWAAVSRFRFQETQDYLTADIKISFERGDHGDKYPFDGPGGVLAHAYAPTDGRFHYDADEKWYIGASLDGYDVESVAMHEIGHLLGLGHSSVGNSIMYPSLLMGTQKLKLDQDDIDGIRSLYA